MKLFYLETKHRSLRPAHKELNLSCFNRINLQMPLSANAIDTVQNEDIEEGPSGRAPGPVSY